jgi:hypothetical protein
MADEVDLGIEDAAATPASASVTSDGRSATARSLPDLIAAEKYVNNKAAVSAAGGAWGCVGRARVVPPGTTGPSETTDS